MLLRSGTALILCLFAYPAVAAVHGGRDFQQSTNYESNYLKKLLNSEPADFFEKIDKVNRAEAITILGDDLINELTRIELGSQSIGSVYRHHLDVSRLQEKLDRIAAIAVVLGTGPRPERFAREEQARKDLWSIHRKKSLRWVIGGLLTVPIMFVGMFDTEQLYHNNAMALAWPVCEIGALCLSLRQIYKAQLHLHNNWQKMITQRLEQIQIEEARKFLEAIASHVKTHSHYLLNVLGKDSSPTLSNAEELCAPLLTNSSRLRLAEEAPPEEAGSDEYQPASERKR